MSGLASFSAMQEVRRAVDEVYACPWVGERMREFLERWFESVASEDWQGRQVAVHGDFTTTNILFSSDQMFVTDWEWACPAAAPWEDLWAFLMSCALNTSPDGSTGRRSAGNLLAALSGRSVFTRRIRSTVARYLERSGTPRGAVMAGLLAMVARRVLRDFRDLEVPRESSAYYEFLNLAAQSKASVWEDSSCIMRLAGG